MSRVPSFGFQVYQKTQTSKLKTQNSLSLKADRFSGSPDTNNCIRQHQLLATGNHRVDIDISQSHPLRRSSRQGHIARHTQIVRRIASLGLLFLRNKTADTCLPEDLREAKLRTVVLTVAGRLQVERSVPSNSLRQNSALLVRYCVIAELFQVLIAIDQLVNKALRPLIGYHDRPSNLFALAVNIPAQNALHAHFHKPIVAVSLVIPLQERSRSRQTANKVPHRNLAELELRLQRLLAVALEDLVFAVNLAISSPNQIFDVSRREHIFSCENSRLLVAPYFITSNALVLALGGVA